MSLKSGSFGKLESQNGSNDDLFLNASDRINGVDDKSLEEEHNHVCEKLDVVEPSDVADINFDEVLNHIGEIGFYQKIFYVLMCIPASLPAAFLAFSQIFLSAEPDHWCHIPELENLSDLFSNDSSFEVKNIGIPRINLQNDTNIFIYEKCFQYDVNFTDQFILNRYHWPDEVDPNWPKVECKNGWDFDRSEYQTTLVTEFNLVCNDNWWVSTCTSLFYVGSLFGNVFFGFVADKYGRRPSLLALLTIEITLSIATCFSPNYIIFTVLRTINGLTFPALFQIPFILAMEVMGVRYRTFAGMVMCLLFAVGLMILAGLSYFFNTWFSLSLVISFPFVSLLSYWWIIPESPRWLLSYGRLEEAEVIIQDIARCNKKSIPENFLLTLIQQKKLSNKKDETNKSSTKVIHKPSMFSMIRFYPVARRNFLLITFNWMTNALVYNGLSFYSANLNVSSHLGFLISSAVEIPSQLVGWYLMDRWGRRWVLFASMIVGGLSCISCMFVPQGASPWITVTLTMVGKFQIAASFSVIYVYAGELMPTVIRSEAMGISSFVSGLGLLLFPYVNSLGSYSHILPLVIMGVLSAIGGVVALFLPETLNKQLPNTMEEGEKFGSKFTIWSCPTKRVEDEDICVEDKIPDESEAFIFSNMKEKIQKS